MLTSERHSFAEMEPFLGRPRVEEGRVSVGGEGDKPIASLFVSVRRGAAVRGMEAEADGAAAFAADESDIFEEREAAELERKGGAAAATSECSIMRDGSERAAREDGGCGVFGTAVVATQGTDAKEGDNSKPFSPVEQDDEEKEEDAEEEEIEEEEADEDEDEKEAGEEEERRDDNDDVIVDGDAATDGDEGE